MSKDIYAVLADQIRVRRKSAKLSIEKLAEIAGIGAGFLAHIETNQKKPSVATLAKIADALHVPVGDLFRHRPVTPVSADQRLAFQLAHSLSKKTSAQKKVIVNAVRALAKGLSPVKKRVAGRR